MRHQAEPYAYSYREKCRAACSESAVVGGGEPAHYDYSRYGVTIESSGEKRSGGDSGVVVTGWARQRSSPSGIVIV
ncbi:hypothetical protein V501_07065 [Pseudogymnoascus sp. VKM F-4519 (FW-2642)]|nr:hypothetical protein V501_07065 [Pseudogymnoascus sp. VKM F-4519 (FW-2642)]